MLKYYDYKRLIFRFFTGVFFLSGFFGNTCQVYSDSRSAELVPNGYVKDFLKGYSKEETDLIFEDSKNIKSLCFRNIISAKGQPVYVATAGGPGASKSTILETYLQDKPNYAYVDPDQRALRYMINTYLQEFTNYKTSKTPDPKKCLQDSYNKWRGASNFIASSLLNEAFSKGYNIAHGTTSTSPHVTGLYKNLKDKSYKIILLLSYSTDENRVNALTHRAEKQNFCQVDPDDIVKKGKMFPERFKDYFQYADEIHFYWTEKFDKGSIYAASLVKGAPIKIYDAAAMEKFKQQYEHDRKALNREEILPLEKLIKEFK